MLRRHTEFFGPDFARGPHAPNRLDAAALNIATAIAQLRAPVSRAESDVLDHADFIRQLADRLAPDDATFITATVGAEVGNTVRTDLRTALATYSLIELWLADSYGGGLTSTGPSSVTFSAGTMVEQIVASKHYRVLTTGSGTITATVGDAGSRTWYWAVSRRGRVFYTDPLYFK
jgi:hypothetical protein